jgi:hypothetical protein
MWLMTKRNDIPSPAPRLSLSSRTDAVPSRLPREPGKASARLPAGPPTSSSRLHPRPRPLMNRSVGSLRCIVEQRRLLQIVEVHDRVPVQHRRAPAYPEPPLDLVGMQFHLDDPERISESVRFRWIGENGQERPQDNACPSICRPRTPLRINSCSKASDSPHSTVTLHLVTRMLGVGQLDGCNDRSALPFSAERMR